MWTDRQFWLDASWRAFRTFIQAVAGGLVASNTVSAFNAPWYGLVGAGLIASLLSLAQSVDRERAVGAAVPAEPQPAVAPMVPGGPGCGGDQR